MQTELNVWLPGYSPAVRFRATAKSPAAVGALAILALVVGLAGCSVGSEGLPSGLPGLTGGAGNLTITTTTMPDGIVNRSYNRIVNIQGGTAPYTCTATTSLPAGLNLTTVGNTCLVSGIPTAVGPALPFTIQVSDSSLPTVRKSVTYNYNVRAEYSITFVPVMPDGVQGRSYGIAPLTPPTAMTSVSPTVGGGALASCTVTGAGGNTLTGTVVGGSNCAASASAANMSASGVFPAVTFMVTDTGITDPVTSAVIVPPKSFSMTTGLTVQPPLTSAANLAVNPAPDAVQGRTYGAPAKTNLVFTAAGGITGQTVNVSAGTPPTGIVCTPAGATLTCNSGGAPVTGTTQVFTVTAIDPGNSATPAGNVPTNVTINVDAPLMVSAFTIGNVTELRAITTPVVVATSGGLQPTLACSLSGGPAGVTVATASPNCTISGTPGAGTSAASPYLAFTVNATDAGNATTPPPAPMASATTSLIVNPPLSLSAFVLPNGTVNQVYGPVNIPFTGGNGPFACSAPALPATLSIAVSGSNCQISGTPTATFGPTSITVTVTDTASTSTAAGSSSKSANLTINPAGAPLSFSTTSPLPAGTVGRAFSFNLAATGGTPPYSFSPTGALNGGAGACAGLTMAANGQITGTPTTSAGSPCVAALTVTDNAAAMITQNFSITINAPLTITSTSPLLNGVIGRTYNFTFAATGGNGALTWSNPGGSGASLNTGNPACAGLSINAGGMISGTSTAAAPGNCAFNVQVSDAATASTAGGNSVLGFNLPINAELVVTTTQAQIPNALLNFPYPQAPTTVIFAATGGAGSALSWTQAGATGTLCPNPGGTMPPGINIAAASGVLSGTPTTASTVDTDFTFAVCVEDGGNANTPGNFVNSAGSYQLNVFNTNAYIAARANFTVEVIDTTTNTQTTSLVPPIPIPVTGGNSPVGVAISPDGAKAYITFPNAGSGAYMIIDTITNAVTTAQVNMPSPNCQSPKPIIVTPDNKRLYIVCTGTGGGAVQEIAVFDAGTNTLITEIPTGVGSSPTQLAARADNQRVYVTLNGLNELFIIDNTATPPVPLASGSLFALDVTTNQPSGIVLANNGAQTFAFVAKQNPVSGPLVPRIDVVDVTTDPPLNNNQISLTAAQVPHNLTAVPGDARIYFTITNANQFGVIDNTVSPPVQVGAGFNLPDPAAAAGAVGAWDIAIPPLSPAPATGLRVYITENNADNVAIMDNQAAPAKNAVSPIALTAGANPLAIRSIPVPK